MCKRCSTSRQGYKSAHEVWEATGRAHTSPLWVRVLWPRDPTAYPRYLVEQGGRVVAIHEPDCPCWHIRTADDDQDVNDNLPPEADDFDLYLEDKEIAFQFDTADPIRG